MSSTQRSRCDVPGCQSDSTERIHRVPEDPERRQAWLRRIGWPASKKRARIFVCRRHFSAEDYMQHPGVVQAMGFQAGRIYLNRDALPSLLLPSSPPHAKDAESSPGASTSDTPSSTPMDFPPLLRVRIAQLMRDLPEDDVEIAGEGQWDLPGYSAKCCTYSVLATEFGRILRYKQTVI
ncbi:uncharacterized protein LOC119166950 [Rhipicephalus microplus]|uniref:uncharacterized protein LOC119166950 n=1 Tax=Rhipicephalus microplus TaxID=6941 RepID=UPI0018894646|nr:uncharacterized protein LOC119166950 isoform X1 [Rhipicephalus microplus]